LGSASDNLYLWTWFSVHDGILSALKIAVCVAGW